MAVIEGLQTGFGSRSVKYLPALIVQTNRLNHICRQLGKATAVEAGCDGTGEMCMVGLGYKPAGQRIVLLHRGNGLKGRQFLPATRLVALIIITENHVTSNISSSPRAQATAKAAIAANPRPDFRLATAQVPDQGITLTAGPGLVSGLPPALPVRNCSGACARR